MNRVYGILSDYAPIRRERTRTVVCYGLTPLEDGEHYEWNEVYFNNKQHPMVSLEKVKEGIIADINAGTTERITHGFPYTVKHGAQQGTEVNVWLSKENQSDFHAMHQNADALTFPVRYKVGEDAEGNPVYEEFADADEMHDICQQTTIHVLTCQQQGWEMKDSIDWSDYDV